MTSIVSEMLRLKPCMKIKALTVACLLAAGSVLGVESFIEVEAAAKADLRKALEELAELQQSIAMQKEPIAKELNSLEDQALAKSRELDKAIRSKDNKLVDLNVLKNDVSARAEQVKFLAGVLTDFANQFETRIHISEVAEFKEGVASSKAAGASKDLSDVEKLKAQVALVDQALDRAAQIVGGRVYAGKALAAGGKLEEGTFAQVGPVVVYASASSPNAGLAKLQVGSPETTIVDIGMDKLEPIKSLTASSAGQLPFDPSGGNALKIAATEESFSEHVAKGGIVMFPLLGLGVVSVIIGVLKYIQLSGIRTVRPRDLQIVLDRIKEGRPDAAMEHAKGIQGPAGELMVAAVAHSEEKKEYIEEVLYEKMLSVRPSLERWLPLVALTAATAPLLGLLGTVTGMINTFRLISVFGTGDPKMLSSGISEALITTEFGLIVAIPALLIHAVCSRKVKGVLGSMEQTTVGFINGVPDVEEVKKAA